MIEILERLRRMDNLIRTKATGTPGEFAEKLKVSERTVYENMYLMKKMGAPIKYNRARGSYVYEEEGQFKIGFELY